MKFRKLVPNIFFLLLLVAIFSACSKGGKMSVKSSPKDPFNKTMVESRFFEIKQAQDTVLEGKNGLVLSIPQDAFLDKNGDVVTGDIKIELAQPETFDEILLSNLSTQSEGKPLGSKGIFYINATSNGEPLFVNPDSPVYMELPSGGDKKDVLLFKGERGEDGKMNWTNPKPVEKFLVPVDLAELDFLPEGFANKVKEGMPFRKHTTASQELTDSLYYSLHNAYQQPAAPAPWTREDRISPDSIATTDTTVTDQANCGIDPASIKTLKEKKFQNTLISTREFELRLKQLHKICDNTLLELYAANLGKNLWEIDAMVARELKGDSAHAKLFNDFSKEMLTTVEQKGGSAQKLSAYYSRRLKEIKKELEWMEGQALAQRVKKDELAAKKKEEYHKLLEKREKYRMDKFGFKLREFGWFNGAVYIEDLEKFILEITVTNGKDFDRVNTYIFNPQINSLFAMVSDDKTFFNRGYWDDRHLLMWKHQEAEAIVIAYKGEQAYYEKQVWTVYPETEKKNILSFAPKPVSDAELRVLLKEDRWSTHENKIRVDQQYQAFFYEEEVRQNVLRDEAAFLQKLRDNAFPCCSLTGEKLFKMNCSTCHRIGGGRLIGADLAGVSSRIPSDEWFIKWVKNSDKLIKSGDPYAVKIFEKDNRALQTSFEHLADEEIKKILDYINTQVPPGQ